MEEPELIDKPITPQRLEFRDVPGAGLQIYADCDFQARCVEYTLKKGYQPVLDTVDKHNLPMMVGTNLFIQFRPQNRKQMEQKLFQEMVDCWNEKYAKD